MQLWVPLLEKYSEESAQHTDTCLLRGLSLGAHPYIKQTQRMERERCGMHKQWRLSHE